MNNRLNALFGLALLTMLPMAAFAQTPVDDRGNVIGKHQASPAAIEPVVGNEDIPLLSRTELEDLVGPIALYPDDLLAIVLPASAYPLQIVDAARFLEALEEDPSLEPDPEWDDSVVALLNYPEIIEHLNEDIDWTWRLGEAVVAQQNDVVAAIERFRDRAYAAGNLKSDSYQNVSRSDGVIEITPVADDVIYVPYYEPERVVVYQPRPVYYYYPRAYPVYYYPYAAGYHFNRGYFWGVTTAFTIGWMSDSLHVYHHSYHGHPYYGWTYWDRWWYRRPALNVYNTTYVRNNITINRYYEGDRWQPRRDRRHYADRTRVTRNRLHPPQDGLREPAATVRTPARTARRDAPITFRERHGEPRDPRPQVRNTQRRPRGADKEAGTVRQIHPERRQPATRDARRERPEIRFRSRPESRDAVSAERREHRTPAASRRTERREPATVDRREPRQTVTTDRRERRQPSTVQRSERRAPVTAQRRESRAPVMAQRHERRAPTVTRRQESREPVARSRPEPRRQASSPAPRPAAKSNEKRRSEARERKERGGRR